MKEANVLLAYLTTPRESIEKKNTNNLKELAPMNSYKISVQKKS